MSVFENLSGPQSERIKKEFQKVFNENGLKIVIKCNLKVVDYLDATFSLNDGSYKPYKKPNDETLYIHAKSNHPPNIIKQLPISVENRLRNLLTTLRTLSSSSQSLWKIDYEIYPPVSKSLTKQPLITKMPSTNVDSTTN